jgi:hypothetical protein
MNDLVKFRIPAAFVLARAVPRPAELRYGYEHGWLDDADAVAIALALYGHGAVPPVVEELALLLSDDFDRVPSLVSRLSQGEPDAEGPARLWLFLALAWVHAHAADFADPYETVEMLYTDFGYPSSIEGMVRFMPPPPGQPTGMGALEERWRAYLAAEEEWFRAHRLGP